MEPVVPSYPMYSGLICKYHKEDYNMQFAKTFLTTTPNGPAIAVKMHNPFEKKHNKGDEDEEEEKKVMRVVSLDGMIDVPYDKVTFIAEPDADGTGYSIKGREGTNEYLMAHLIDQETAVWNLNEMRHNYHNNRTSYKIRGQIV